MSGHSHWAGIKHKKAINDSKRGKVFTKLGRALTVAAQTGGTDPSMNFALRIAIDTARAANMSKDTIERAIARGSGADKNASLFEEVVYEAYGPGGIALLITATTDNRNRTVAEVKHILNKNGGKFVPTGSVAFLFRHVGILVPDEHTHRDALEVAAIECGADDFEESPDGTVVVITQPQDLAHVRSGLERAGITITEASLTYLPKETTTVDSTVRQDYETLRTALEDNDDVQDVFDTLAQ